MIVLSERNELTSDIKEHILLTHTSSIEEHSFYSSTMCSSTSAATIILVSSFNTYMREREGGTEGEREWEGGFGGREREGGREEYLAWLSGA